MADCPNPNRAVFEAAIAYLGFHDVPERRARSRGGKWRKEVGDTGVFNILCAAYKAGVTDPVPWIGKAIENGSDANVSEDVVWRTKLALWKSKQFWRETFDGPPPGQPGCRVPKHLLEGATDG